MSAPIPKNGHEPAAPANGNGHPASDNPGTQPGDLDPGCRGASCNLDRRTNEHRSPDRRATPPPQAVPAGERDAEVAQAAQADRGGRVIACAFPNDHLPEISPRRRSHHANETQRRRVA